MFIVKEQDGIKYIQAAGAGRQPVFIHGFSTRVGGASRGVYDSLNLGFFSDDDTADVQTNWSRFLNVLNLEDRRLAYMRQEHGVRILRVTKSECRETFSLAGRADCLWTDDPGLALAVVTADCVPVLFSIDSSSGPVIAAVHAGWRGLAAGIVNRVLSELASKVSFASADVRVIAGPAVCQCCYPVNNEVTEKIRSSPGFDKSALFHRQNGSVHLSLQALLRSQTRALGLADEQVLICDMCTCCHEDLFFSYRRSRGAERGRMAAVIALSSEAFGEVDNSYGD